MRACLFTSLCALAGFAAQATEAMPGPVAKRSEAVLDTGNAGAFDEKWVSGPSVLFDGQTWRMWYGSVFDSKMGRGGIGLATSHDGIHWQRANQGEPVLETGPAGAFDDGQVMGPEVLFDGEVYRLWYAGMSRKWHASGFGHYRIGLATSRDGIHWQRENGGRPVLDLGPPGAPDEVQAATPTILREGATYRMWYAAWAPGSNHTLCVARSHDGVHWERENDGRPIEGLSPPHAFGPAVTKIGERYFLLYMALNAPPGLFAATSTDGLHWDMLGDGQPWLAPGDDDAFDGQRVGHPYLLLLGERLKVWFTGYQRDAQGPAGYRLRIGFAESHRSR